MKAKIYYIIILGLLFLHPRYSRALEPKQDFVSSHSFQKTQKEQPAVIDGSQNSAAFFSAVLYANDDIYGDIDPDDDDVSSSVRKKISFEKAVCLETAQYRFQHFYDHSSVTYYSPDFYHLPPSHFISLRVFRI